MGLKRGNMFNATLSRRDFLKGIAIATATMGLPSSMVSRVAKAAESDNRPPVIWLHFQECTGCSEALLRASHPTIAQLILDIISLDYHETLIAAGGKQAEEALQKAMKDSYGKYILVVEGSVPVKDGGIYCKIGGKTCLEILKEVAKGAFAIVAIGSCASFGGVQSAPPNPTGATGVPKIIKDKPVITLPGCPPSPYNLLSTVLYVITFGKLPKLDKKGRPLFAYGRTIHDHCERRPHFNAGRFVEKWGDEGHRKGWCLYKMGCKGPVTHANCPSTRFNDVGVWPVSAGHPCVGCTEEDYAFKVPIHEIPPVDEYLAISEKEYLGKPSSLGAGLAGLGVGAAIGGAVALASKLPNKEDENGGEEK
jgi:hydrogenase small subunit